MFAAKRLTISLAYVVLGVVIGLTIAFLWPSDAYSFRISDGHVRSFETAHRHDAHSDSEVDDVNAPEVPMHFHSNSTDPHEGI